MLIPDNIHPRATVYFNGAVVLRVLKQLRSASPVDLFQAVRSDTDMSLHMFTLSVDWLYLLKIVVLNDNGEVALCS